VGVGGGGRSRRRRGAAGGHHGVRPDGDAALLGHPLPDWYLPVDAWTDGLDTATLGVLWPVAALCVSVAILRTAALPRWAGWTLAAAGVALLAQMVAFGGVIPAPMFIAWTVVGVAALRASRLPRDQAGT